MVKTITITDDVYEELVKMKGNRSFSELLRDLIKKEKGNKFVLVKLFGILSKEEYKRVKKVIKEIEEGFEEWGKFLIQV